MKFQIEKAMEAQDWTRLEVEFLGEKAHLLTDAILACESENDLKNLILSAMLDKYMFFYISGNRPHKLTKLMLELLEEKNFKFEPAKSDNYELDAKIKHILLRSGLFPLLYYIEMIWGKDSIDDFLNFLLEHYEGFEPNLEHQTWLKQHQKYYKKKAPIWFLYDTGEQIKQIERDSQHETNDK